MDLQKRASVEVVLMEFCFESAVIKDEEIVLSITAHWKSWVDTFLRQFLLTVTTLIRLC